mmetsp:Transcript_23706/g.37291  ORF Transcript_23706/g.37291 Transcript_23706/m.37291 type:complete len:84 (-) Transcript_23706:535-786(-)
MPDQYHRFKDSDADANPTLNAPLNITKKRDHAAPVMKKKYILYASKASVPQAMVPIPRYAEGPMTMELSELSNPFVVAFHIPD